MPKRLDFRNKKIGRLTAIQIVGKDSHNNYVWECLCDCGNVTKVSSNNLKSGNTLSCGCLGKERRLASTKTHGKRHTRTYHIWLNMKQRCENQLNPSYKNYGGRGISVCERWHDFSLFLMDMGECPDSFSIERLDVNKGYSPDNCVWANKKDQANNTRVNIVIEYDGQKLTLKEWADKLGVNYWTLHSRYKRGWDLIDIITKDIKNHE